jgi:hypothetical protein
MVALVDCVEAASRMDHRGALDRGRVAIHDGEKVGVSCEAIRWCWPLAAEAALELEDLDEVERLLAWTEEHPVGHLHPIVRCDRLRVQARLAAARGEPDADALFERAVASLRGLRSPYHLAIGLRDYAAHSANLGHPEAAQALAEEAHAIAEQLGARPLLAQIDTVLARSRVVAI